MLPSMAKALLAVFCISNWIHLCPNHSFIITPWTHLSGWCLCLLWECSLILLSSFPLA